MQTKICISMERYEELIVLEHDYKKLCKALKEKSYFGMDVREVRSLCELLGPAPEKENI